MAAEKAKARRRLTMDELMSDELTLAELDAAAWSEDGRTLSEWLRGDPAPEPAA